MTLLQYLEHGIGILMGFSGDWNSIIAIYLHLTKWNIFFGIVRPTATFSF